MGTFPSNNLQKMVILFVSLLFLVTVTADQCPDNLINTNYTESMGCIHADTSLDEYFDTYGRALNFCKGLLGNRSVLVEIKREEEQQIVIDLLLQAEEYMYWIPPELIYWWSGLKDEDDDAVWNWPDGDIANYTNWHPQAIPGEDNNHDCMQLLSASTFGGQWMTFECSNNFIDVHPVCQLPNN